MDLLNTANTINSEFGQIRIHNDQIMNEQERVDIFDSIVTCLTNGLAEEITLVICDKRTNQVLQNLKWSYNLLDEKYIKRVGPDIHEIVSLLEQVEQDAYLDCQVQWSDKFQSMAPRARARLLRGTIWDEQQEPLKRNHPLVDIDLGDLEDDLQKLATGTKLVDDHLVKSILQSVSNGLSTGNIVGVRLMFRSRQDQLILDWEFKIHLHKLVKKDHPIDEILEIVDGIEQGSRFETEPILSSEFRQMPPQEQLSAMKDTVWASDFR